MRIVNQTKSDAKASVDAALVFATAVVDRILPESLMRVRPEWTGKVLNGDNTSKSTADCD